MDDRSAGTLEAEEWRSGADASGVDAEPRWSEGDDVRDMDAREGLEGESGGDDSAAAAAAAASISSRSVRLAAPPLCWRNRSLNSLSMRRCSSLSEGRRLGEADGDGDDGDDDVASVDDEDDDDEGDWGGVAGLCDDGVRTRESNLIAAEQRDGERSPWKCLAHTWMKLSRLSVQRPSGKG